jgi:uncharacterized cupredoxin-like copper-binding protein
MHRARIALLLVALALLAAFPAAAAPSATTTVAVKTTEMKFTFSKLKVKTGTVVFTVTNKGVLPHDLKIAGKKSALIKPGKSITLRFASLKAGKYAYLCTVPGHAPAGMKGTFTVVK